ncbi:MAG TPA: energy transducer TonB [Bryobacteraceae bacterium]|nr:energy transducer TonB [Bryobacteraceae bacterium]
MFEQTFIEGQGKTNRVWTVLISFVGQVFLIGVLILIPMIYFDALPRTQLTSFLVAPPPPPPPPPPPAAAPVKMVKVIPRQFDAGRLMAPKTVPKNIAMIKEEELPPPSASAGVVGGVPGGVAGGQVGGVIGGIIGSVPSAAPPPPPPPVEQKKTVQRIRVGGQVQQANLIRQPKPIYPPLAKQARIQGVVRFEAIIGKDGTIQNLRLVSGHPLLVPAAQEAVKQWLYKPTLLNGEPVEVATVIDVNFTLSQ